MAPTTPSRGFANRPFHGAKILLVSKNPEDLSYYEAILRNMHCKVQTSSSFGKGVRLLEREQYDLVVLDQGSSRFEGRQVLRTAIEADAEVPVLVLARTYDTRCYEEAMQSGALDYVEGRLGEAEIVAFLDTFVPLRNGSPRPSPGSSHLIFAAVET